MKRLSLIAAVLTLAVPVAATAAVKKPYFWSSAKVVTRLKADTPIAAGGEVGNQILRASCEGIGRTFQGRYRAFSCPIYYGGSNGGYSFTLSIRILPVGKSGRMCVVVDKKDDNYGYAGIVQHNGYTTGGLPITLARTCP